MGPSNLVVLAVAEGIAANALALKLMWLSRSAGALVYDGDVHWQAGPRACILDDADEGLVVGTLLPEQDQAIFVTDRSNVEVLEVVAASDQKARGRAGLEGGGSKLTHSVFKTTPSTQAEPRSLVVLREFLVSMLLLIIVEQVEIVVSMMRIWRRLPLTSGD